MQQETGGEFGLKMKHNERISPEAEIDYPEPFPFQHHQKQQKLTYAAPFIPPNSCSPPQSCFLLSTTVLFPSISVQG